MAQRLTSAPHLARVADDGGASRLLEAEVVRRLKAVHLLQVRLVLVVHARLARLLVLLLLTHHLRTRALTHLRPGP